jgi:hypothetical protein
MLVVHSETGIAIPVSYLLTRDHRTSIIAGWLNALTAHIKSKLGVVYAPKVVFASLSNIRFDALQTLFPKGRAFYCNFYTASHVQGKIQSFMRAATKGNGPEANVDTIEMMNEASRQVTRVRCSRSLDRIHDEYGKAWYCAATNAVN